MDTVTDDSALEAGRPWPLGAHWDGRGVNFALFSAHAEAVELCVFDGLRMRNLLLRECTDEVWHGYLVGAAPGLHYAYRVHGPAHRHGHGHGHEERARQTLTPDPARSGSQSARSALSSARP